MSDFSGLNIALTGLSAAQRALMITGQNVTNANTDGLPRETVNLEPVDGVFGPSIWTNNNSVPGGGVSVTGVTRYHEEFLDVNAALARRTERALHQQRHAVEHRDDVRGAEQRRARCEPRRSLVELRGRRQQSIRPWGTCRAACARHHGREHLQLDVVAADPAQQRLGEPAERAHLGDQHDRGQHRFAQRPDRAVDAVRRRPERAWRTSGTRSRSSSPPMLAPRSGRATTAPSTCMWVVRRSSVVSRRSRCRSTRPVRRCRSTGWTGARGPRLEWHGGRPAQHGQHGGAVVPAVAQHRGDAARRATSTRCSPRVWASTAAPASTSSTARVPPTSRCLPMSRASPTKSPPRPGRGRARRERGPPALGPRPVDHRRRCPVQGADREPRCRLAELAAQFDDAGPGGHADRREPHRAFRASTPTRRWWRWSSTRTRTTRRPGS